MRILLGLARRRPQARGRRGENVVTFLTLLHRRLRRRLAVRALLAAPPESQRAGSRPSPGGRSGMHINRLYCFSRQSHLCHQTLSVAGEEVTGATTIGRSRSPLATFPTTAPLLSPWLEPVDIWSLSIVLCCWWCSKRYDKWRELELVGRASAADGGLKRMEGLRCHTRKRKHSH